MDSVELREQASPEATGAQRDQILYWNGVSLEANRVSHTNGKGEQTGPTLSSRALAIVHLAMHDAFAGISGAGMSQYLPGLPAPEPGASADAAVAAAAHKTLTALFPSQKTFFDDRLAEAGLQGPGLNKGRRFGRLVAREILDDRKDDPGADDAGYVPSPERGRHRPDPDDPGEGFHAPFYGAGSRLFAVTKRHELDPPPRLNGQRYLRALREVRGKGIAPELMGTLPTNIVPRTVDETLVGVYWGYDGASGLGTPPRLYNQIVRRIAIKRSNTPAQNARLFALVNVAMADAGILAWDQKYIHDLWRPVLGIREHDLSMGPEGEGKNDIDDDCQSDWLPLGAPNTNATPKDGQAPKNTTPPFPAYPSGHATFGAAAFHAARLFYGVPAGKPAEAQGPDKLFDGLEFVSDEHDGVNRDNKGAVRPRHVRDFPDGLWQMIEENGRSRVNLGVHWVFDAFAVDGNGNLDLKQNVGGVPLGLAIAEDIHKSGLKKSVVGPRT